MSISSVIERSYRAVIHPWQGYLSLRAAQALFYQRVQPELGLARGLAAQNLPRER